MTDSDFQWGEFVTTCVLTVGASVMADSFRGVPWPASGKRGWTVHPLNGA